MNQQVGYSQRYDYIQTSYYTGNHAHRQKPSVEYYAGTPSYLYSICYKVLETLEASLIVLVTLILLDTNSI